MSQEINPVFTSAFRTTDRVEEELAGLESSVLILEQELQYYRQGSTLASPNPAAWKVYQLQQHQWYTVDMPRNKAALQLRIDGYWATETGVKWTLTCAPLGSGTKQEYPELSLLLEPRITAVNEKWADVKRRCDGVCKDLELMRTADLFPTLRVGYPNPAVGLGLI